MNLIRYTPRRYYRPVFNQVALATELDRLFELGVPTSDGPAFPVDLYQDPDAIHVRAELPGFRKEDLQVNVADDVLTLVVRTVEGDDKKDAARAETTFRRKIALPENLDYPKIAAAYENGVLTVTLLKRAEAKPAAIAVEVK